MTMSTVKTMRTLVAMKRRVCLKAPALASSSETQVHILFESRHLCGQSRREAWTHPALDRDRLKLRRFSTLVCLDFFFLEMSSVCFAFCAEKALGGGGAMEPEAAKMKHMERAE
ncbi:hypothetical protein Q7C36_008626 [Tachysurus vachellii]|uniref:Uncharacterized protein n=1 Tax=Tachysurus vachellii TaxID=175792 RepID=A0AA88T0G1_TACVA|nr:hypothetical protein Q7C36_008626 [Tachysurus vachellii]